MTTARTEGGVPNRSSGPPTGEQPPQQAMAGTVVASCRAYGARSMDTAALSPASLSGLSEAEAITRLASTGYNELPRPRSRDLLELVAEVVREPMVLLLLAAGAIYLALGDLAEALL